MAYTALQACSKSRYKDWLRDYTSFLYVLAACTQAIARQSSGEDKYSTHALQNAVKVAQSKIVEHIKAEQKSSKPEPYFLSKISASELDSVGGISDEMLGAIIDYANSDNPGIFEWLWDRDWVRDLERKRDEAKQV